MYYIYEQDKGGDLNQGDILKITPELREVLKDIHPYYAKHKDYKYLMVITQSCDLVYRPENKSHCSAKYITLAAVRTFNTAISREVEKYQKNDFEKIYNICDSKCKIKIERFLEQLFNNNHSDYFYLGVETDVGIDDHVVTFLTLSVPIKADLHYENCKLARIAQLKDVFKAKLGWIIGNLYSRVGTPDWVPHQGKKEDFVKYINDQTDNLGIYWLDEKSIKNLKKEFDRDKLNEDSSFKYSEKVLNEKMDTIEKNRENNRLKLIDLVLEKIDSSLSNVNAKELEKLKNILKNDASLSQYIKR